MSLNIKASAAMHQSPASDIAAALQDGKTHLLLAASGSVATIKLPHIITALTNYPDLSIRVILTKSATHFLGGQSAEQPTVASLALLPNVDSVHQDEDEWLEPWTRNANILHIELRRWAHMLVVAPMSANLLAKVTGGICDDLLTNVIRAWEIDPRNPTRRLIIVAPSMNTMMWTHPLTAKQLAILNDEWKWFEVLPPQTKTLACGDTGQGAMRDWKEIVDVIENRLAVIDFDL
ncbi:phosphopantothenoylcysteine decarboxylase [Histoplasma capsulatum G186AR]|uniref:Phosphopantothenoylcysteine decarboxylase n=2 Tax=Ajellomyces capsulatus TaxID=5037 RepID=C0NXF9_AJECG|nr:phosphopantothenoylcysteine decarboxylase [Histoplasma capsulatum G186AR]EEH04025.1 phosphopantothenoylcysteine decarboxylase [Histoplasma capsulatum G186AR]KAG5295628.1 phosphopantothenoylcysteine decarboxylase [Histoplasma capsulatum]QSS73609.1 phosphopantothenoylcysteine decarboxylase [Histoplasma capsulatum G186AR]